MSTKASMVGRIGADPAAAETEVGEERVAPEAAARMTAGRAPAKLRGSMRPGHDPG
jgi:hypothetical protein